MVNRRKLSDRLRGAKRGSHLQTAHLSPFRLSGLTFIDEELPGLHRPAVLGLTLRLGPAHVVPRVLFPQAGNVHTEDAVVLGHRQDPAKANYFYCLSHSSSSERIHHLSHGQLVSLLLLL